MMYALYLQEVIDLCNQYEYAESYRDLLINAVQLGYLGELNDNTEFTKETIDALLAISDYSICVSIDIVAAVSMLSDEMRRNSNGASKAHVVFVHKNKYKEVRSVFGVADSNNREVGMKLFGINVVVSPYLDENEILMLANPKFTMMNAKHLVMLGVMSAKE